MTARLDAHSDSDRYVIRSRADGAALSRGAAAIEQDSWGVLPYLNYTHAHFAHYAQLLDGFADHQLCLVDQASGFPIAIANTVPLHLPSWPNLPEEGWDWLVETASQRPTGPVKLLGALAISVPSAFRGQGIARRMIHEMKALAQRVGAEAVIAPVRPTAKQHHPYTPIDDYITWTDASGERAYDPWMRSHAAAGGVVVQPARRSMVVDEPIGFWQLWRGQAFTASGAYVLPGALAPVRIDFERQRGRYEEPNVWMLHRAS